MFIKKALKSNNIQGIKIIYANSMGSITVQQNVINWSKRILGNEALTQINENTIIEVFTPKIKLENKLINMELELKCSNLELSYSCVQNISNK